MAIPVTAVSILRVLLQIERNLSGLQRDERVNAQAWRTAALAQSMPIATIAGFMNSAAVAYLARLAWISTIQADAVNWPRISAMFTALGGTAQDFSDIITPLKAVANQLGPAAKTTYAEIISACDQIIAAIDAPLSLWPE